MSIGSAIAGAKFQASDDKWASIGFGARTSFIGIEDVTPSGGDWSNDSNLDSAGIYVNGRIHK